VRNEVVTTAEIGENSLAQSAASITYQKQFVVVEIQTMDSVMWPANCLQTSLIARTFLDNAQA
jgi:hypothetical protein